MNIEELRKLAEDATPGPWVMCPDIRRPWDSHKRDYCGEEYLAGHNVDTSTGKEIIGCEGILTAGGHDAAFIAAANPAAILKLLARLEDAEAVCVAAQALLDGSSSIGMQVLGESLRTLTTCAVATHEDNHADDLDAALTKWKASKC